VQQTKFYSTNKYIVITIS